MACVQRAVHNPMYVKVWGEDEVGKVDWGHIKGFVHQTCKCGLHPVISRNSSEI